MIYNEVCSENLSLLGFGTMRLPTNEDKTINEEKTFEMVDYAIKNGVNYFDTAYPYHEGMSEIVIGKALNRHPRDSWYLATKFPGHQIKDTYNPAEVFEDQLKKCGVDYFDFYLLHNIYENSIGVYMDEKWGILDYFLEQKKQGRIKHLGFSCHCRPENLKIFLDYCGKDMEFCQVQVNYLDWTLQDAKTKYDMLCEWNIPVWVMEPLRGGKLANLTDEQLNKLSDTAVSSAFRFLQGLDNVKVILSGMSTLEQMKDNIKIFDKYNKLSEEETKILLEVAESMKNSVPCTACRYCCEGCPMGLDIPMLLNTLNEIKCNPENGLTPAMQMEALPQDKQASACIGCGACALTCPQKIDIPSAMKELSGWLEKLPSWKKMCIERNRIAEENKKKKF